MDPRKNTSLSLLLQRYSKQCLKEISFNIFMASLFKNLEYLSFGLLSRSSDDGILYKVQVSPFQTVQNNLKPRSIYRFIQLQRSNNK